MYTNNTVAGSRDCLKKHEVFISNGATRGIIKRIQNSN